MYIFLDINLVWGVFSSVVCFSLVAVLLKLKIRSNKRSYINLHTHLRSKASFDGNAFVNSIESNCQKFFQTRSYYLFGDIKDT